MKRLKLIQCLCVLIICCIAAHISADNEAINVAKPAVPSGLYVLIQPNTKIPDAILLSDLIAGVVLRGNWQDIAPSPGVYQFDYYHTEIKRAEAAGKAVSLVINNGGINTPTYIKDHVKQTIKFIDNNQFHKTRGQELVIPAFWDEHLIGAKKRLMTDLSDAFSKYSALKLVSVQCANATTDDWNLPNNANWHEVEFNQDKLIDACVDLIRHSAQVFSKQALRMAIGHTPRVLSDKQPHYINKSIWHNAQTIAPNRFYLQRHNLFVNTPVSSNHLKGWQPIYEAAPYHAAQFLWPIIDTKSCRMNGKRQPCDTATMLQKITEINRFYRFRYLEIYGADFRQLHQRSEFALLANSFKENTRQNSTSQQVKRAHRKSIEQHDLLTDSYGSWNNPPEKVFSKSLTTHRTFYSELLKQEVGYSLYLPENASNLLPVIYWLHGKKGNESRGAFLAQYLDKAIKQEKIRPTAMVFVNGGMHSFYSDSYDNKTPVESMIMKELIPHVEKNHPVSSDASQRLLEGFSMGGFGALKLAAKYPNKFNSVAIFGAALLDQDFLPRRADLSAYQNVFNSDAQYFIENTPRYWLEKHKELIVQQDLSIRLVIGTADGTKRYNQHAHEILNQLDIPHEFIEFDGVRHATRQYYETDAGGSFIFHESSLN